MENSFFAFSLIMNLSIDHNEPNEHLMNAQKILSKKSQKNFSLRVIVAEQPLVDFNYVRLTNQVILSSAIFDEYEK